MRKHAVLLCLASVRCNLRALPKQPEEARCPGRKDDRSNWTSLAQPPRHANLPGPGTSTEHGVLGKTGTELHEPEH